jgi:uncharacterized protein YjgD (DUF1641 family)
MTVTELQVDRVEALEAKIDLLNDRMEVLVTEAERRRRQREAFDDLTGDLARVSEDAMAMATRELESLSHTADLADTVRLLRRLVEVAPTLERALVGLSAVAELVDDAAPLGSDVMAMITDRLALADEKGYFAFATAALGVADRVVTNFDEHDVEQLGENVVAMLEALRDVTQPEMLAFLARMIGAVQAERLAVESEPSEPPSLWALARQVSDPDVRRGMARALHTLRAVSVDTGPQAHAAVTTPATGHHDPATRPQDAQNAPTTTAPMDNKGEMT